MRSGTTSPIERFRNIDEELARSSKRLIGVTVTGEYEHSPIVTADNTLTLLKKETGIG